MARPRGSIDRAATRERILAAAESAFAKSGFHTTSLNEVAAAAGMRAPSLLYHFASKEELFDEVIRRLYRQIDGELTPVLASGGTPREILTALLERLLAFEERRRDLLGVLNAEVLSPGRHGIAAVRDAMVPLVERVEEAIRGASGAHVHPDAPVRQALLHIVAVHAVRTNLRELGHEFWGSPDHEEPSRCRPAAS